MMHNGSKQPEARWESTDGPVPGPAARTHARGLPAAAGEAGGREARRVEGAAPAHVRGRVCDHHGRLGDPEQGLARRQRSRSHIWWSRRSRSSPTSARRRAGCSRSCSTSRCTSCPSPPSWCSRAAVCSQRRPRLCSASRCHARSGDHRRHHHGHARWLDPGVPGGERPGAWGLEGLPAQAGPGEDGGNGRARGLDRPGPRDRPGDRPGGVRAEGSVGDDPRGGPAQATTGRGRRGTRAMRDRLLGDPRGHTLVESGSLPASWAWPPWGVGS